MWEEYITEARTHVASLGERALEVRYEDFLQEPEGLLEQLSVFSGLKASPDRIKELTSGINKDRAFAYRNEPELVAFAGEMSDRLKVYGY
jgi:hypothetical protein